jgi:chromosome segregation ATPase
MPAGLTEFRELEAHLAHVRAELDDARRLDQDRVRQIQKYESSLAEFEARLQDEQRLREELAQEYEDKHRQYEGEIAKVRGLLDQSKAGLGRLPELENLNIAHGANINRLEGLLANAEARLLDAQRLIERNVSIIRQLELRLQLSEAEGSVVHAELDEAPSTQLEDVLKNYGLQDLSWLVKARRMLLEDRQGAKDRAC